MVCPFSRNEVEPQTPPEYRIASLNSIRLSNLLWSTSAIKYFVFPITGRARTVEGARIILSSRQYYEPGQVLLSLKVYNLLGEYQSTVSSSFVNLKTIPLEEWVEISLSQNEMDRTVHSNEYLAFDIEFTDYNSKIRDGGCNISFEVDVESFKSGDKSKFSIGEDVII